MTLSPASVKSLVNEFTRDKDYTKEEVFEMARFAIRAMLKQGKRSVDSEDKIACRYRGPNGLKCAIGHLIPDDLYDEVDMESNTALYVFHILGLTGDALTYLDSLQSCHDYANDNNFVESFTKNVKEELPEEIWYGILD